MSKSAITPWRSGRVAEIVAGVRPIILSASAPTACTRPVCESDATTDGSETTMPRPPTYTSVFAVPRSIAMSRTPSVGARWRRETSWREPSLRKRIRKDCQSRATGAAQDPALSVPGLAGKDDAGDLALDQHPRLHGLHV